MTYKFDIGVYIVPKHIFHGRDWTTFGHFDLAKGWPVTTGPWQVVFASPEQKVLDRQDDWWAANAGLAPMPRVERNVWLPWAGEQQRAQALITDQLDTAMSMQPSTFRRSFGTTPGSSRTAVSAPARVHGLVAVLPVREQREAPFDDPEIRWALSYCIDRKQIAEVGFLGAAEPSPLPMPSYPGLRPYIDSVKGLLDEVRHPGVRPQEGREDPGEKGLEEGTEGLWENTQGGPSAWTSSASERGPAVGPVVTELLRRQGVDAVSASARTSTAGFRRGSTPGRSTVTGGA